MHHPPFSVMKLSPSSPEKEEKSMSPAESESNQTLKATLVLLHQTSRVIAEFLRQMDGIITDNKSQGTTKIVLVLAATNKPWDLDEAIRRRLEKRIYIPLPEENGRLELFKLYLREVKLADDLNWDYLVKNTEGYSGADIFNVCRDAAMMPMRKRLEREGGFKNLQQRLANVNLKEEMDIPLTQEDFENALKNVKKAVGDQDLKAYAKWMEEYGAKVQGRCPESGRNQKENKQAKLFSFKRRSLNNTLLPVFFPTNFHIDFL
eukprot:TRINITY_DN9007_c0_g1_i2.p2 TRINITY_DN9007_c0_g1~~TRINITY_DN9007_c0_g1_i2.p2  ORF type:complete len:262 (+),score=70.05 TRINITY_DN9007_c0_g1_i2:442-1227(+)